MSTFIGKVNICDRCGAIAYSKKTGTGSTDGGYTTWDKYDEIPDGWNTTALVRGVYTTLCPECNKRWLQIGEEFINGNSDNN